MKTKLHVALFLVVAFGLICSAGYTQVKPQATVYGTDIQIFDYYDCTHAFSKLSVADNGWIYVMALVEAPTSNYQAWRIWRSTDEGQTFTYLCQWEYYTTDNNLRDVDMVVTGSDASNINVWVAEISNTGSVNPSNSYCRVTRWDANGTALGTPYYLDYGAAPNEIYHVAIATDYRSPGTGSSPFSVAIAFTGWYSGNNWLSYAYSLDGGTTFTGRDLYSSAGYMDLGRVSLSLGGTNSYSWGRYGIAFEMNKAGDLADIGVIVNYTDNTVGAWTTPVTVNTNYPSMVRNCRYPTISVMDNMAVSPGNPTFFPFVVAFEDWSVAGDFDIAYASLKPDISPSLQPTVNDFIVRWIGTGSLHYEMTPNVNFDKTYNNFLLTYLTDDNNQLIYRVSNMEDFQSGSWVNLGNYRDANTWFGWDPAPRVDINLSKAMACFSWTEQDDVDATQSVFFDAEWSVVGIDDQPGSISASDFRLAPNPAKGQVTLTIDKDGEFNMVVSDFMGRNVLSRSVTGGKQVISLENLSGGIYVVRITGEGIDATGKLVVE